MEGPYRSQSCGAAVGLGWVGWEPYRSQKCGMVGLDGNPTDHRCVGWLGWMGTYRSQKCGITVGLGWKGPYRSQYHSMVGLEVAL